jgi:DNA recombination protein RmuC
MDWTNLLIIVLAAFNLLALILIMMLWRKSSQNGSSAALNDTLQLIKAELGNAQNASLEAIRQSIDRAHTLLNTRLAEGTSSLDRRMEVISEIQTTLGQLKVQAENMETVGRNIQTLSELLRPPKVRGGLGETLLENLIGEILPRSLFETQYRFSNGQKVDAAIKVGERYLPIDAKFPLEAFERLSAEPDNGAYKKEFANSLKKHIDDIASKYIRPTEHTTEFALIYLPAERIYYEIVTAEDQAILSYALSKRVIPTSPAHLYPLLVTISSIYSDLQLSTQSLAEGAHRLSSSLAALRESVDRQRNYLGKMQGSLKSAGSNLDRALDETNDMEAGLNRILNPKENRVEPTEN